MNHNLTTALSSLKSGQMVILTDDHTRENEGDLVMAAQYVDAESINFMAKYGRGLICLALDPTIVDRLGLTMMTTQNESKFGTGFTVSIEARTGVTTGISASDRAHTIQTAIHKNSKPTDIVSPGHIFPLRARKNGVLERSGQTEGSVDLCKLAELEPAAVICEIMNEDGTMARIKDLKEFSIKHDIPILNIADIQEYRLSNEIHVEKISEAKLPVQLRNGLTSEFKAMGYLNLIDQSEHIVVSKGTLKNGAMIRVHSECLTGDAFSSARCDCGEQLKKSLELIDANGSGAIIYLKNHEGRGIGLINKLKAYALQDLGADTVEANHQLGFATDARNFSTAAQILKHMNLNEITLITNNPHKTSNLELYGITVLAQIPIQTKTLKENEKYLETKKNKMGHNLNLSN